MHGATIKIVSVLSFVGSMLNKSEVWSLWLFSYLVGLRTYQHPLIMHIAMNFNIIDKHEKYFLRAGFIFITKKDISITFTLYCQKYFYVKNCQVEKYRGCCHKAK
jgi:hypothetical protein